MKLLISWLKEHLETSANVDQIVNMLEKIGTPCEKIYKAHESWSQIQIVKIINKSAHPNADKLNLYEIELKDNFCCTVVCGDKTLEIGAYVPYARPGTVMPNGTQLSTAKIRGIESLGMLCSCADLNIPTDITTLNSNGVLRSKEEFFGQTVAQAYESEAIIEIETTPNQGDLLSIRGIARALANQTLGKLIPLAPYIKQNYKNTTQLGEIQSPDCKGLALALIEYKAQKTNAKIETQLQLTGHITTGIDIIDLTNYIAHEIGQPMHAFDYSKLNGPLKITNCDQNETYLALNNQEITLNKGTLVIKNNNKTVSWPGVIGSANSKIENSTSKILLETGVFKIDSMQRRKNKIYTWAAKRFECGVDPENLTIAINRFCSLLNISSIAAEYHPFKGENIIQFNLSYIKKILGIDITLEELKNKLEPRGFKISDDLKITVPSYKFFDITTCNCIVEEFALGEYDSIKSINLSAKTPSGILKPQHLVYSLVNSAIECGFYETYNFTLTNDDSEFSNSKNIYSKIQIANSTNKNYAFLRTSLIPQLLKTASWHINNSYEYRNFFEIGLIYGEYENGSTQKNIFTAIATEPESLMRLFYNFLEKNNLLTPDCKTHAAYWQASGRTFMQDNNIIAHCGMIKEELSAIKYGVSKYYALEIFPDNLKYLRKKQFTKPLSQSPVYKDISFILPENFEIGRLIKFLENQNLNFSIFDIYPTTITNTKRNVGIRFMFESNEPITLYILNNMLENIKELAKKELDILCN